MFIREINYWYIVRHTEGVERRLCCFLAQIRQLMWRAMSSCAINVFQVHAAFTGDYCHWMLLEIYHVIVPVSVSYMYIYISMLKNNYNYYRRTDIYRHQDMRDMACYKRRIVCCVCPGCHVGIQHCHVNTKEQRRCWNSTRNLQQHSCSALLAGKPWWSQGTGCFL